eukprot:12288179-Alexandrium_andersonii.AAC.1
MSASLVGSEMCIRDSASLASTVSESSQITEGLPRLPGALREDAQRAPDPASTPTIFPPSEASP